MKILSFVLWVIGLGYLVASMVALFATVYNFAAIDSTRLITAVVFSIALFAGAGVTAYLSEKL